MFNWHKKEKPLQGMAGFGGGATSRVLGGGVAPIDASGGTKYTPGNGYVYHVFQYPNSDAFTVNSGQGEINYLLVAGGGAGGHGRGDGAGGGGGGQVLNLTAADFAPGTYPVTVGQGGIRHVNPPSGSPTPFTQGTDGGDTTFNSTTAGGGGIGAGKWSIAATPPGFSKPANPGRPGTPGGSGSGGGAGGGIGGAGTGSSPGGNPGGNHPFGGGGGGAGGSGSAPAYPNGANGGPGAPFSNFPGPLFTSMPTPWKNAVGPTGLFGGGGGAAGYPGTGTGGPGGGGNSAAGPDQNGNPGVDGTGGGGGGAGSDQSDPQSQMGGFGGHGLCIVRYLAG